MTIIQDTVDLSLSAEHTIINNTVKLVATVSATVTGDVTEDALRADIKATMKSLVDADWVFSNMQRNADDSGYERVTVTASVRVPESENYNLENRSKDAGRIGLKITSISADTSVPASLLEEAESELRKVLVQKVLVQRDLLSAAVGKKYRVHSMVFGGMANLSSSFNSALANNMTKATYGTGFGHDGDALGNASKLTMNVSVKLAHIHASTDDITIH